MTFPDASVQPTATRMDELFCNWRSAALVAR